MDLRAMPGCGWSILCKLPSTCSQFIMKCLKVLKRHLINHLEIYTQIYQPAFSSCSFLGFFCWLENANTRNSISLAANTANTPRKINTCNEGLGSMIFLCTWVSLRFQPLIFQRVTLISSSAEVSTVSMWTGNLNLNLLWRPHRLNHLNFFGAILNPKTPKDIQHLSCNIRKIHIIQRSTLVFCQHNFEVILLTMIQGVKPCLFPLDFFLPLPPSVFAQFHRSQIWKHHRIALPRCYGNDGCLSCFFSNFKLRYTASTCDNSDVVQLEVFSFYEYSI